MKETLNLKFKLKSRKVVLNAFSKTSIRNYRYKKIEEYPTRLGGRCLFLKGLGLVLSLQIVKLTSYEEH
jgi:hypothetical protein